MDRDSQSQDQRGNVLECRTDNSKLLTNMLSCLLFKEQQKAVDGPIAWMEIKNDGLRLAVEEAKNVQASVYLTVDLFSQYWVAQDDIQLDFGVNLGTLVECLRIFGSGGGVMMQQPPNLTIQYNRNDASLSLTLIEGSAVTEVKLHTFEVEPITDFTVSSLNDAPTRILMKSETLREGLAELEWGGDSGQKNRLVTLQVTAEPPQMALTSAGEEVGCEVAFPKRALNSINVKNDCCKSYRYSHLHSVQKALVNSQEACVRVHSGGILHIMVRFKSDAGDKKAFLEFYVLSTTDCEEDEEEDEFGPPSSAH